MKNFFWAIVVCILVWATPSVSAAQDHAQVGVFADYFRLDQTNADYAGVGARARFNLNPYIGVAAEMNYDFDQAFSQSFVNSGTVTVERTNIGVLHGLFGPELQTGHGPIRAFITVKGGFINFRLSPGAATFGTFANTVNGLRANNVDGVLYPGAGIEAYAGVVGLRLDVGDEIYFNNGTQHNLRVTLGPVLRF